MQPHTALYILALLACSSAAAADRALLQTTRMDDLSSVTLPQANAAASALRIATVQATPSGPVFTLAGQLDSASQLLQAMTASQDLVAAMSPEAVAQLNSLAADAAKIDANAQTGALLAGLENPVTAGQLLTQMAELNTAAPATTAAAAAPMAPTTAGSAATPAAAAAAAAPPSAPTSGAGAPSVAVMATAGAALLAALLL